MNLSKSEKLDDEFFWVPNSLYFKWRSRKFFTQVDL